MNAPISIQLDPEVHEILEVEAKSRGVGLATYVRQPASDAARAAGRERIRIESTDPTPENGYAKRCFAPAPFITSASLTRVRPTPSRITDRQLRQIRLQVTEAIGSA